MAGIGGDDEHEDHHRAVEGEDVVVEVVGWRRRRRGFGGIERGAESMVRRSMAKVPPSRKAREHRDHVHDADALVVEGEQPGHDALAVGEVIVAVLRVLRSVVGGDREWRRC